MLRSQMVAVATRYLDSTSEAEDVTQDALLKLWSMHKMLKESDIERLAFTILKHLCVDELRRREYRKGQQAVDIDSIDLASDTENPQDIEERERQLMIAMDKLPSRHRMLLQLRYLKGKDVHTIAEITGSTEESINMTLSRARSKVYKYMSAVVVAIICLGLFPFIVNKDNDIKNENEAPVIAHQPTIVRAKPSTSLAIEEPAPIALPESLPAEITPVKPQKAPATVLPDSESEQILQEVVDYYDLYVEEQQKAYVAENNAIIGELMEQYQLQQAEHEANYLALCQFADQYAATSQEIIQTSIDNKLNDF